MDDARIAKVVELRELARQFRSKADETQLLKYIDLMRRSAAELDYLADQIEAQTDRGAPQVLRASCG